MESETLSESSNEHSETVKRLQEKVECQGLRLVILLFSQIILVIAVYHNYTTKSVVRELQALVNKQKTRLSSLEASRDYTEQALGCLKPAIDRAIEDKHGKGFVPRWSQPLRSPE